MRNPALRQRIHQRHGYMVLSRNIRETLWPVFPCKNLICHIRKIRKRVAQQPGQSTTAATSIVSPARTLPFGAEGA
jgi:hypothetical protein